MKGKATNVMGLAGLSAMLVLGVSAGSAQASSFLWTGALPSLVLILADGPQVFTAAGTTAVTCQHARFHGKVTNERQLTQVVVGQYTGCEALSVAATVTPVEYELNADQTVSVINKTITISVGGGLCVIEVKPQNNLKQLRYLVDPKSNGTRLLGHAEVTNIVSFSKGLCGIEEGEHTEGTYNGLLLAFVHGSGALTWVQ